MSAGSSKLLNELLKPVVESLDCELWGLEFHSSGRGRSTLRIYIEKAGGVGLSDCEKVSRQVSSVMDVEDPIPGEYTLEVSSPGLARPLYTLEQYKLYVGEHVKVKLRALFEGRKIFTGLLTGIEEDEVKVLVDDHEYFLPIESIDKANVAPRFENSQSEDKAKGKE